MHRQLTAIYVVSCVIVLVAAVGPRRVLAAIDGFASRGAAAAGHAATAVVTPASPARAAATTQAEPAQKPRTRLREYKLPIGSTLSVALRTPIDSRTSRGDEQVDAVLSQAIARDGVELIPAGSLVHGRIVDAVAATRKAPRGQVTLQFAVVKHAETGSRAAIQTETVTIVANEPEGVASSKARREPIDVQLASGYPLVLTLAKPLLVFIPDERP